MKKIDRQLDFIFKYLKIKKSKNVDVDYLAEGYLDSLSLIKFIMSIEKNFQIKLNQKDFINRKFRTIKGLATIIKNKKIK
jgi:acyl carrier protein